MFKHVLEKDVVVVETVVKIEEDVRLKRVHFCIKDPNYNMSFKVPVYDGDKTMYEMSSREWKTYSSRETNFYYLKSYRPTYVSSNLQTLEPALENYFNTHSKSVHLVEELVELEQQINEALQERFHNIVLFKKRIKQKEANAKEVEIVAEYPTR